jgi:hypothetical protein
MRSRRSWGRLSRRPAAFLVRGERRAGQGIRAVRTRGSAVQGAWHPKSGRPDSRNRPWFWHPRPWVSAITIRPAERACLRPSCAAPAAARFRPACLVAANADSRLTGNAGRVHASGACRRRKYIASCCSTVGASLRADCLYAREGRADLPPIRRVRRFGGRAVRAVTNTPRIRMRRHGRTGPATCSAWHNRE